METGLNPKFADVHEWAREAAKNDNAGISANFTTGRPMRLTEGPGLPGSCTRKQWDLAYNAELQKRMQQA